MTNWLIETLFIWLDLDPVLYRKADCQNTLMRKKMPCTFTFGAVNIIYCALNKSRRRARDRHKDSFFLEGVVEGGGEGQRARSQNVTCQIGKEALQVGLVLVRELGKRVPDDLGDPLDDLPGGRGLLGHPGQVRVAEHCALKLFLKETILFRINLFLSQAC